MSDLKQQRREFIRLGVKGIAAFAGGSLLSSCSVTYPRQRVMADERTVKDALFSALPSLGPLQAPDENGMMLPRGYKSRIVARTGFKPVSDSDYVWHMAPDGGATFQSDDGGWIYVSNSEMPDKTGGVGALRFNSRGELVDAYSILSDTTDNCAGGKTPWQTWLSCEEHERGMVYECDPFGAIKAEARPALGVFKHEAVAVDVINQHLYLTEDEPNGCLYRFRPNNPLPDLGEGVLEVAIVSDVKGRLAVTWQQILDPTAAFSATRNQVAAAARFNGGEGIAYHNACIYFTTKGDNRVWIYNVRSQHLEILYDIMTSPNPVLRGVDNVTITPAGDVIVAEDGGDMQLVALTETGVVVPILQLVGQDSSELTGPAFDPYFKRLYVSSQSGYSDNGPGFTYEITGPM
jgi:secreted PhoX family phosphatase